MRAIFHIALLILYLAVINSSIISDVKSSLTSYLTDTLRIFRDALNQEETQEETKDKSRFEIKHNNKMRDGKVRKRPNIFRQKNKNLQQRAAEVPYRFDPVLNDLRKRNNIRRQNEDSSGSSNMEIKDWKSEWKEHWIKKKLEAINSTEPRGDVVNMVAARPWGVPCGDPAQHDMPWGNCLLAMECEAEYRIYRGDYACGRTKFVCCAVLHTSYDIYQAFDNSFADSGLASDSEDRKQTGKGAHNNKGRNRRKKERENRKTKIKKNIKEIIKEIKKILDREYSNATKQRHKKTKQLKKFIGNLKKKYKHDRKAVKNLHESEMMKVDGALMDKLEELKQMNLNFVSNSTFRDIIVNGKMTKTGARMLIQAYPELVPFFTDTARKSGNSVKDYLDYDIEYGMLYY